jgi:hypothetical protein
MTDAGKGILLGLILSIALWILLAVGFYTVVEWLWNLAG